MITNESLSEVLLAGVDVVESRDELEVNDKTVNELVDSVALMITLIAQLAEERMGMQEIIEGAAAYFAEYHLAALMDYLASIDMPQDVMDFLRESKVE